MSQAEMAERIELVFGIGAKTAAYPILYRKEIRATPEIRILSSGNLFQTLDLKNFATARRPSRMPVYRADRPPLCTTRWA